MAAATVPGPGPAEQAQALADVLGDGERGLRLVDAGDQAERRTPAGQGTVRGPEPTAEREQRGGPAAARGAGQGDQLARVDGEVEIPEDPPRRVRSPSPSARSSAASTPPPKYLN
ncbi:hypothetical protein ACFQZ4_32675 [Catellatospora coxensis]